MRLTGIEAAAFAAIVALAGAAPSSAQNYWPNSGYGGNYSSWYGAKYYTYFPYTHNYYPYYSYYSSFPPAYNYNPYGDTTYPQSTYAYPPSVVAPGTVVTTPPSLTTYQSSYPSYTSERAQAPVSSDTAVVRILTAPDAQLTFNGVSMTQTGAVRTYETPGLLPGANYRYDVKIRYTDSGVPVERERSIKVTAGQTTTADLTPAALRQ
jgi:uncharacterized protein (TIGR03000 family)